MSSLVKRPPSEDEPNGATVVMNRQGAIVINDDTGRERERYQVIYGAEHLVKDGAQVEAWNHIWLNGTRLRCPS